MGKETKLALDTVGAVGTLTGIGLLFAQELYVAGASLVLVGLGIAWHAVVVLKRPPIKMKSIVWSYRLCDPAGKRAEVTKLKRFVVQQRNVTTLTDRHFAASGSIKFVSTSMGRMSPPFDEAGTLTLITTLAAPLEVGQEYAHEIELLGLDSFTGETENVGALVDHPTKHLELIVEFPDGRRPTQSRAFWIRKGQAEALPDSAIDRDRQKLALRVEKPKAGSKYILEWDW